MLFNKILFFMVFNDYWLYGWYANSWPIFLIKIMLLWIVKFILTSAFYNQLINKLFLFIGY
ncbi:hypothetical protein DKP01_12745 [Salmonella enterica subsp. enterica serovar Derby]|nr:hypothetical protein [Salmonella enterica subsp. enterica serovar Derby]